MANKKKRQTEGGTPEPQHVNEETFPTFRDAVDELVAIMEGKVDTSSDAPGEFDRRLGFVLMGLSLYSHFWPPRGVDQPPIGITGSYDARKRLKQIFTLLNRAKRGRPAMPYEKKRAAAAAAAAVVAELRGRRQAEVDRFKLVCRVMRLAEREARRESPRGPLNATKVNRTAEWLLEEFGKKLRTTGMTADKLIALYRDEERQLGKAPSVTSYKRRHGLLDPRSTRRRSHTKPKKTPA